MRIRPAPTIVAGAIAAAVTVVACVLLSPGGPKPNVPQAGAAARIRPDYSGLTLPPNIAPLNFRIMEPGSAYEVRVRSANGRPIRVHSRTGKIAIPRRRWRRLLDVNRGGELHVDVYVRGDGGAWRRYDTMTSTIAGDEIDPYLVYRSIEPAYNIYGQMGLYERDLESYREDIVVHNSALDGGCVHCHTFCQNGTDAMLLHFRPGSFGAGMLLIRNGVAEKARAQSAVNPLPAAYTTWHPSQRALAFSVNHVRVFFHSDRPEPREFIDMASDLAIYELDSYSVTSTPAISSPDYMETWPRWSPDGEYLYFCRAPALWTELEPVPPERFADVRYSLMRIRYDLASGEWGELETVLDGDAMGRSISQPRFSPDGRFLVFCMSDYSAYATFQPDADLYLMDLRTGTHERLSCSSDHADSWHSWSSNGRWLVFSSKGGNGLFNRPYIAHVDADGRSSKPFVMPQRDPDFYLSHTRLFQTPELIKEPVRLKGERLAREIRSDKWVLDELPVTSATGKAGQKAGEAAPMWRSGG